MRFAGACVFFLFYQTIVPGKEDDCFYKKERKNMQSFKPCMEPTEKVLSQLGSDKHKGLTQEQASKNRLLYGTNTLTHAKPVSLFQRIIEAMTEPMLLLLVLALFITIGVNIARHYMGEPTDFIECIGILIAIGLSVAISVFMENRSAKAFEALNRMNEDILVKVLRDGQMHMKKQKDIVVGDIVSLETGDKIPADGRLIDSTALYADESALTGESMVVLKKADILFEDEKTPLAERVNMMYAGCFITSGHGKMVVTNVGDHTEFGKIAKELSSMEKTSTPLQEKLQHLSGKITLLGALAAGFIFVIQVVLFWYRGTFSLSAVLEAFTQSIILIVAAVPEGLPTIVAVSLALNIIKLAKEKALVKKMIACETVGCINVICSDKTGTLTENKMTVTDVFDVKERLLPPQELKNSLLIENFCLNSTADVCLEDVCPTFIGNPTEGALLTAAYKAGHDYRPIREEAKIAYVYSFSSQTKNMTTLACKGDGVTVYSKGSPEKILSLCLLDLAQKEKFEKEMTRFQEKAARVIAFAHREITPSEMEKEGIDFSASPESFEKKRSFFESNLTFDGFVAISDPLRAQTAAAVAACRQAGIDIKILTGDNLITASAIAQQLNLLSPHHKATEAKEIEELSDEQLKKVLPQIRVIARSTPGIKMRVVNALKSLGNVVAVTGDGINDAPALKNADVGIAMGISGTEVSKEASDIVLLDDSFSTITRAIKWGRGIYKNFQRFIQFQLTVNLSSVSVVLISVLAGLKVPFTALQLLWVNIIMDGPPALTLGLEKPGKDLMKEKPTQRNASIVSASMLFQILANGLYICIFFMAQYFTNFMNIPQEQQATVLFTLFIVFQLFNAFNSRELGSDSVFKHLGGNVLMVAVFTLTFGLQILITQFGGSFFDTVPLSLDSWVKVLLAGASIVAFSEILKFFKRLVHRS